MFFFGPKVLLLLKRRSLEIYFKGSDNVMNVEFHSTAVRHLEVVNRDEVIKTLVDAFKSSNLKKQTAVIALSDHIVFDKLIPNQNPVASKKETLSFFHNIPLQEQHIATKLIPLKGSVLALGANRELYQIVAEVAREFEWNIKAIVPMTLFAKTDEHVQLTSEQVKHILGADSVFKEGDFLSENILVEEVAPVPEGEETDPEEKSGPGTKVTLLIALFLVSLIVGSLFFFKIITLPFDIPFIGSGSSPVPTATPVATESAQLTAPESTASAKTQEASVSAKIKKTDIRIHVLNGSEISGQATKIKEKLKKIGYENVITGNIESSEASGSSIVYSESLEASVKDEINKLMDSLIEGVTKTDQAIKEFNAVITLGKLEKGIE